MRARSPQTHGWKRVAALAALVEALTAPTATARAVQAMPATPPEIIQIRVDPTGRRGAPSPESGATVATLADAVAWARDHAGAASRFEVVIASGVHTVQHGLVITKELPRLTIRAESKGARLVGGLVIEHPLWHRIDEVAAARLPDETREHVRALDLPKAALAGWSGGLAGPVHSGHGVAVSAARSELFVGGVALTPSRWPNAGFASIESVVDPGSVPRNAADDIPLAKRVAEPARGGTFIPKDRERVARWAAASDAWALGYWNWDWSDEMLPIARVDAAAGTVTLAMPHQYGLAARGQFLVTNLLEELDSPGEYWIDRANAVVYAWLPAGAEDDECAVSLLDEPMIRFDGCRGAEIDGLTFECTRSSAIDAKGVTALLIRRSTFRNLGTRAIGLDGRDSSIRECLFEDVGGTGVSLSGGDRPTLEPASNVVEDCTFRRCGRVQRTYSPAILMAGVGHRIAHNEIADLPHIAIIFSGNDHVIEANDIHDVVLETGDAGAVYVGRDWTSQGTVIRKNLFHSIRGNDARYQNAVYLDDMASGITVEENLFVSCNWGMLVGGGRDDKVRRNVFAGCGKAISFDARGVGWMAEHLADPSTSTLHRNLAAMPVDKEPWKSRYPALATYLTDRFGRPVRGEVSDNLLIGTPLGSIEDRECVREEGTVSEELPPEALSARCESLIAQARGGPLNVGPAKLGPVGPRKGAAAPQAR